KLKIESDRDLAAELEEFSSDRINSRVTKLERNDEEFLEYAFELHHYYDTQAMGYFYQGESIVKKSMRNRENYLMFLQAMNQAEEQYKKAREAIGYSMELNSAMDCYFEAHPNNSLVISLPSDAEVARQNTNRSRAVEHYHLFLVLTALGNIEEAEIIKEKIRELGYEPNRLLF
ncbi:MAG: hypothetical protein VX438_08790, partial [Planctomycetota bacterium]|nr:hypothetical protein [Planctomycetota bacterium]